MLNEKIENRLAELSQKIIDQAKDELQSQGRVLTGNLRDSLRYEIKRLPNITQAIIFMADYGFAVDAGVKADNIPFQEGSGRKSSKYIDGLQRFFMLKGLLRDEALSAAFATAKKHKKEGMPLKGRGKRTGFFSDTVSALEQEIQMLNTEVSEDVRLVITNFIQQRITIAEKINVL